MYIGYFTSKERRSILVVMDYGRWFREIHEKGFNIPPVVTRLASSSEHEAMRKHKGFPGWLYDNIDELIDDEIKTGTAHYHLSAILEATAQCRWPDHPCFVPQPQASGA